VSEPSELQVERDRQVVVARPQGDVDISRVERLRADLVASVDNRDLALVVDLTATSYLDSAGINMLFELAEALARRQIQLAVVVPDEGIVARVASLVSLESAVPVHRTAESAIAALGNESDAGG
jgi:anti-anti-sigma factor